VTCKTVKKNGKNVRSCTTKVISGTAHFTTLGTLQHATLSRAGVVYAVGVARGPRGRVALRLAAVRRLRPGRYTLTLVAGSGRHATRRTVAFTLR
jgi:hypothetical protein